MVVKRVGPLSAAKIAAIIYAIFGLIFGGLMSLFGMAGALAGGGENSGLGAGIMGMVGVGAIVFLPIFYACLGFVMSLLLGGLAVMAVARLVSGFHVKGGFGSYVLVGLVYGILKMLLQKILIVVTFPAVILTLGLFILVINAFLLWLTDKLMKRFTVDSAGSLFIGALLLSLIDWVFQLILRGHSALF